MITLIVGGCALGVASLVTAIAACRIRKNKKLIESTIREYLYSPSIEEYGELESALMSAPPVTERSRIISIKEYEDLIIREIVCNFYTREDVEVVEEACYENGYRDLVCTKVNGVKTEVSFRKLTKPTQSVVKAIRVATDRGSFGSSFVELDFTELQARVLEKSYEEFKRCSKQIRKLDALLTAARSGKEKVNIEKVIRESARGELGDVREAALKDRAEKLRGYLE